MAVLSTITCLLVRGMTTACTSTSVAALSELERNSFDAIVDPQ